jgi:hypothetical protein
MSQVSPIVLKQSTKPGECGACNQTYPEKHAILVQRNGDTFDVVGCEACGDAKIRARVARLSGVKWYPAEKKYKCESCGKWDEQFAGAMVGKAKIPNHAFTGMSVVVCRQCPDLTPAESAKIKAGPTEDQTRNTEQKNQQANHARNQKAPTTPEEAEAKLGNWAEAAKTLSMDPILPQMARRRGMDLGRLMSCFAAQAIRDINCCNASVDSWTTAFRDALQLGTYPGKGPFAESYLIARFNSTLQMQEITLQAGYKCVAAVILTAPGTNIKPGVAWPCQAILGNLAAPFHAAVRNLRRAEKAAEALLRNGIYDPRPVEAAKAEVIEAANAVKAAGKKMLDRIPADIKDANQQAMRNALLITAETHGRDWFTWEWYRFHAPTDLLIQDYPSATFWKPPAIRNSEGQVPSLACCVIERRGAPPIACEIPADQVLAIAVKGRQATQNGKGGLNGTVWGDDLGCHHMWHKTALIQLAVHGRFPLREVDPERAAILSRTEAAQSETDEGGGSYLAVTVADAARHQSQRLRQQMHPEPAQLGVEEQEDPFEWEEREPVMAEQDEYEPGSRG